MPMYTWRDETSKKEVEVLRNFSEYQEPPTQEEAKMTKKSFAKAVWTRLVGSGIKVARSYGYGRKGHWILLCIAAGEVLRVYPGLY